MKDFKFAQKMCAKGFLAVAMLMSESVLFAQGAGSSNTSDWVWNVTVEDPQGKMADTVSVCLLTESTTSLEALDAAIANGSFVVTNAPLHFLMKQGRQDVKFKAPYTVNEIYRHGIYALFSNADPLKSACYSVGYWVPNRDELALSSPPPGYYFDSTGNVVLCHCNISTITFANAKRTGWSNVAMPANHPLSIVIVHSTSKP